MKIFETESTTLATTPLFFSVRVRAAGFLPVGLAFAGDFALTVVVRLVLLAGAVVLARVVVPVFEVGLDLARAVVRLFVEEVLLDRAEVLDLAVVVFFLVPARPPLEAFLAVEVRLPDEPRELLALFLAPEDFEPVLFLEVDLLAVDFLAEELFEAVLRELPVERLAPPDDFLAPPDDFLALPPDVFREPPLFDLDAVDFFVVAIEFVPPNC